MTASRYSVRQSSSVAGAAAGSSAQISASPRSAQPALISASSSGRARRGDGGAGNQQRLGRAADAGAAHLRVDDEPHRLVEIGGRVDIDMHDAFEMREHRHARLALHALDQRLAAARHDHVERAAETRQHLPDRLARGERRARDRRFRQARLGEAGDETGVDRGGGVETVGAAAQHHGIAALQAQARRRRRSRWAGSRRSRRRRRAASPRAR